MKYVYSIYWALTTLTTVGYGDITPCNDIERNYTLLALLIGALVFGYMVSTIGALIAGMDRQASAVQDRIDGIKEYTNFRQMPRALSARIRTFYSYHYAHVPVFDEARILSGLTPQLRADVTAFLLDDIVGQMPLFRKMSKKFQGEVFPRLRPEAAAAKETIIAKGYPPDRIYFIRKGDVEMSSHIVGVSLVLRRGEYFGETLIVNRCVGRNAALTLAAPQRPGVPTLPPSCPTSPPVALSL